MNFNYFKMFWPKHIYCCSASCFESAIIQANKYCVDNAQGIPEKFDKVERYDYKVLFSYRKD